MDSTRAEIENRIRCIFAELTKVNLLCTCFEDVTARGSPQVEKEKLNNAVNELSMLWRSLPQGGVRDTLKLILEQSIPVHLRPPQRDLAELAEAYIQHICSREANLLPAYFVINEIKKMFPDVRCFSHWMLYNLANSAFKRPKSQLNSELRLADMYTKVIDSFRPLAQMVSVSDITAFFTNFNANTLDNILLDILKNILMAEWRISENVSRNSIVDDLTTIFGHVMNSTIFKFKNNTYNLTCGVPMRFPEKMRCPMLEEMVLSIILEVMFEIEKDSSRQHRYIWQILATELVYMVVQQMISFTRLVQQLHQKVR
ncbi:unnamed protein product [Soboliphyme baturini]|uniref:Mediator of RNA polymerase II transcription subunit 23 n=1 Tax=Soboliphyme baturini TaxID=241478 RepID=A0A183IDI9_9BILA|nr:unnamed protein product [Soboliphyme baturini]